MISLLPKKLRIEVIDFVQCTPHLEHDSGCRLRNINNQKMPPERNPTVCMVHAVIMMLARIRPLFNS